MEIASNKGVIADASTPAGRAGMSESEWREAIKFDSTDTGWVIMSIGMAIGAGIVFLPVQVGLMGLWVFLLSSVIGYPAMYLFQRLFINTLAESPECKDYPSVISGYLGKNWGILLGALYFVMLVIWMFVYSTAITNDSASYLHTFGVTEGLLSDSPFYGLVLICILVAISSRGEKLLFKISTGMVLTKLLVVAALGVSMVGMWHLYNVGSLPPLGLLVKNAIITLPFTLTSILFIQTLSPMVISYRSREKSIEVARHKALRAMNIAFGILFVTVFFYAVSFTLAMGHDEAVKAYEQNISALAIAAQFISGDGAAWVKVVSVILNIFAVMTAFFGVYLGFREATQGIVMNILRRKMPAEKINENLVQRGIMIFAILLAWSAIVLNAPVLSLSLIHISFKKYAAQVSIVTSSLQYENDDLMRTDFNSDDYAIACCVSPMVIGKQMQFFGARANLAKTLLYAINGGVDEKLKIQVGPKTAPLMDDVLDYDKVMDSLDNFMDWLAVQYISALNIIHYMHDKYSYEASLMALHDRDVYRTMACGIAGLSVATDSLSAIKYARVKPIRDENGLAVDFEIDGEYPQYGNNDERVDSIACDLVERFMKKIKALPTYRNAVPTQSILTITSNVVYGQKTGNTPDGRRAGTPFAPGANPMHGRDRKGAVASLTSVAKLPFTYAKDGISYTFSIVPAALGKEDPVRKTNLVGLLDGYFHHEADVEGGQHLNVNVMNREMLLDAIEHPEKYPNLTIRVSGYAVRFNALTREQQQDVISRTFIQAL